MSGGAGLAGAGAGNVKSAVLTVSDGVSQGTREDRSGDVLEELLAGEGYEVERRVVPDERDAIADAISQLAGGARLVLTTGGTGLGPRDVTPEATLRVLDRAAPGIAEAIRADSIARTPHALLSRGTAGVVGATLVVNLPGSPGGCRDGFAVLKPALGHSLELLAGEQGGHKQT
jgi:molybdopterin adenylyltransferase